MESLLSKKLIIIVGLLIIAPVIAIAIFPKNKVTEITPSPTANTVNINTEILNDIKNNAINCTSSESCTVDKVVGSYAKGLMPQGYWIAIKKEDKWNVVVTGNGIPSCKEIDQNTIPKEIFGNCIEESGQLRY